MNIVMVSGHACIRVHKMTAPLVQDGYKVHLITKKMPPNFSTYYYSTSKCDSTSQIIDAIKVYAKTADVFHCHNEPSWFVTAVKEVCGVPVILDVHDSYVGRVTDEEVDRMMPKEGYQKIFRYTAEERNNFQLADGLVFPGKAFADMVCDAYSLKQPRLVLPSYLPRAYYQYNAPGWLGGLVYEGRVDLPNKEDPGQEYGFRYADYLDVAKQCKDLRIDFHVYSSRSDDEFIELYKDVAYLHPPHPYHGLLLNLQSHDWGLVGNITKTPEWEVAFPNKMFEYIAAAVPVVAINAPECGKFIEEFGFGIKVDSLEELAARWSEHEEVRKTLIKNRQKFVMEAHIDKLKHFYDDMISDHGEMISGERVADIIFNRKRYNTIGAEIIKATDDMVRDPMPKPRTTKALKQQRYYGPMDVIKEFEEQEAANE